MGEYAILYIIVSKKKTCILDTSGKEHHACNSNFMQYPIVSVVSIILLLCTLRGLPYSKMARRLAQETT